MDQKCEIFCTCYGKYSADNKMLTVHTYRWTNLAFSYLAISAREESTFSNIWVKLMWDKVGLEFPFKEAFNNVILSLYWFDNDSRVNCSAQIENGLEKSLV